MPNPASALALKGDQKAELEALVRNGNTPQKVALRCRLLLLAHQGLANQTIAEQLNLSRPTILAFRTAFAKDGVAARYQYSQAQASSQGADTGTGAEGPGCHPEDPPW